MAGIVRAVLWMTMIRLYHLPVSGDKQSACHSKRPRFDPSVRKVPWGREWLPIPVYLPGESHGQRNLESYNPWVHEESDTTERLTLKSQVNQG